MELPELAKPVVRYGQHLFYTPTLIVEGLQHIPDACPCRDPATPPASPRVQLDACARCAILPETSATPKASCRIQKCHAMGDGLPQRAPLPAWGTHKSKAPAPGGCPPARAPWKKSRRPPTLPHCGAVPSAQPGLTSLFGMGRGGAPAQWPPGMDDDTSAQGLATEGGTRRARRRKAGGRERAGTPPHTAGGARRAEGFGQLVALGFGVAAFAPAPYQRRGLRRP